jgi:hypothetical protein
VAALRVHERARGGVWKRVGHGWLLKEERRGVQALIYRRESEHWAVADLGNAGPCVSQKIKLL